MLSIANPSNGQPFFSLLYAHNWVKDKDMVGLTKDKVHSIATAKITPDRYLFFEIKAFVTYACVIVYQMYFDF